MVQEEAQGGFAQEVRWGGRGTICDSDCNFAILESGQAWGIEGYFVYSVVGSAFVFWLPYWRFVGIWGGWQNWDGFWRYPLTRRTRCIFPWHGALSYVVVGIV